MHLTRGGVGWYRPGTNYTTPVGERSTQKFYCRNTVACHVFLIHVEFFSDFRVHLAFNCREDTKIPADRVVFVRNVGCIAYFSVRGLKFILFIGQIGVFILPYGRIPMLRPTCYISPPLKVLW